MLKQARARRRGLIGAAAVLAGALILAACGSDSGSSATTAAPTTAVTTSAAPTAEATTTASPTTAATTPTTAAGSTSTRAPAVSTPAGAWPRTVTHERGEATIPDQPERIVSTSLTVTGTLLAIGAPVIASAATSPGGLADDNGFFVQWSDVAAERGVDVLYPNLEFDLEAVIAAEPDLIVVSTSGADSVADRYDELAEIAPTIVVNYGNKSWQDLAVELAAATGHETEATKVVDDFDRFVADSAAKLKLPDDRSTSVVVYNGTEEDAAVAKTTSAQAKLLTGLGFEVVPAPDGLDTSEQVRQDFAFISQENVSKAMTGATILMVAAGEADVPVLTASAVLANAPAVTSGQVHALGLTSFRIDFYSATDVVETITSLYG